MGRRPRLQTVRWPPSERVGLACFPFFRASSEGLVACVGGGGGRRSVSLAHGVGRSARARFLSSNTPARSRPLLSHARAPPRGPAPRPRAPAAPRLRAASMAATVMETGLEAEIFGDAPADDLPPEFAAATSDDVARRTRLLSNEVRVLRDEATRLNLETANLNEKVSDGDWEGGRGAGSGREAARVHPRIGVRAAAGAPRPARPPGTSCHCGRAAARGAGERGRRGRALNPRPCLLPCRSRRTKRRSSSTTSCPTWWAISSRWVGAGGREGGGRHRDRAPTCPPLLPSPPQILDLGPDADDEEDGAAADADAGRSGPAAVLKTSTRQTVFLPVIGLVDPATLKPGDLVGVNKDSYLVLDALPAEYDARVKAMEVGGGRNEKRTQGAGAARASDPDAAPHPCTQVDEKPTEDYSDVGGLDKQIQELVEAVVLPVTHKERFKALGIKPPKGVLLYGPPGTGKTLIARACAAQTNATFLKLAGPQLVQMFIGDGAKLVRDAFALAKEKAPCIVFIDEIDAVGTKRFDSELSGDREVQRTMLELLNQLDGFSSDENIKVIAATNRADILDPALMRSGRLDRKIEFPHPNEDARAKILAIHARRMTVGADVNYDELARGTDDFNAAQLKAVCVEAGMLALRRGADTVCHEDFNEGVIAVQSKKKALLNYYA